MQHSLGKKFRITISTLLDAVFLFDQDVKDYLDGLRKKPADLRLHSATLHNHPLISPGRDVIAD
jgi:hypothetical protein